MGLVSVYGIIIVSEVKVDLYEYFHIYHTYNTAFKGSFNYHLMSHELQHLCQETFYLFRQIQYISMLRMFLADSTVTVHKSGLWYLACIVSCSDPQNLKLLNSNGFS